MRKGLILSGGSGSRLYPMTKVISKQLMPIYDKPMIYFPLSVLMMSDIREILIITTPQDQILFESLLKDGSQLGIHIEYAVQPSPGGLAQAFIIGEKFIDNQPSALILGDNIFYGNDLVHQLSNANINTKQATVFAYHVNDPERYGVVSFDENGRATNLEEKPMNPKSNYAITGLYYYDDKVCDIAKELRPSSRGELEITDINQIYLDQKKLNVEILSRGLTWLDTGTCDSLLEASSFVSTIQERQGFIIACIEEIAYKKKWIDANQIEALAKPLMKNIYGKYLMELIN